MNKKAALLFLIAVIVLIFLSNSTTRVHSPFGSISAADKTCDADEDCVLFLIDCEDCTYDTLNINSLQHYQEAKERYCSRNPPKLMCDMEFFGTIRCIDNQCVLETEE